MYAQQVATNYVNKCTNPYKILYRINRTKTDPEYIKITHIRNSIKTNTNTEADKRNKEEEGSTHSHTVYSIRDIVHHLEKVFKKPAIHNMHHAVKEISKDNRSK